MRADIQTETAYGQLLIISPHFIEIALALGRVIPLLAGFRGPKRLACEGKCRTYLHALVAAAAAFLLLFAGSL